MSLKLTLDVPDTLAATLRERADAAGSTVEAVAVGCIVDQLGFPPGYGRFRRWAGSLRSDLTDASVRTHEYVTDQFIDPLREAPGAS